jgi:oligopeptide transport system ATP-binding protein
METNPAPKTLEDILGRAPEERRQPVLMSVRDLRVHFPAGGGTLWDKVTGGSATPQVVKAVDGVTLDIYEGESLGLVGESGCGKSTLGRAMLRLQDTTAGAVFLRDTDLAGLSKADLRQWRRHLQMIFQDPYASLNPRMTVGQIVGEPLETFNLASGQAAERWVQSLLEMVGLNKRYAKRYPHEFSGGQRQRIGIARALAASPDLIVADEPISALDVSIQAQVMNLLKNLQKQKSFACLFISHDLRAVRHFSDRIAVMYLGRIVEIGKANEVYEQPLMPYTQALISAVPIPDPDIEAERQRIALQGEVPSPINPPEGCHFHPRCPYAIEECSYTEPELKEIKPGHFAACIRISREKHYIDEAQEFNATFAAIRRYDAERAGDPTAEELAARQLAQEKQRAHEEAILRQKEAEEQARLTALASDRQEDWERERRRLEDERRALASEETQKRTFEERRRQEAFETERARIEAEQAAIRAEQEQLRQLEAEMKRREAEDKGRVESEMAELDKLRAQAEEAEKLRQEAEAAARRAEDERRQLVSRTAGLPFAEAKASEPELAQRQQTTEDAARRAVEARLAQMDIQRRQREEEERIRREAEETRLRQDQERLQREEEIRQRQMDIERRIRETEEARKQAEAERLRLEEETRLRLKAEEEQRLREIEEQQQRELAEQRRREEDERLRQIEAEQELERQKREEEERLRLLEAERIKEEEETRLRIQAEEDERRREEQRALAMAEAERLNAEEAERLRLVEEQHRRQEEEERQRQAVLAAEREAAEALRREEAEARRRAEEERLREQELARQQRLEAERQKLEEEKRALEESRRRAESAAASNETESGGVVAKNQAEEEEKRRLLAEVERLKREAEEAIRRQREAEDALRKEKRLTGELDITKITGTGGLLKPEIGADKSNEEDRQAVEAAPRADSILFSNAPRPAPARKIGGPGVALLAVGAIALIGLLLYVAAKFAGGSTTPPPAVTQQNANANNGPQTPEGAQNPPPGMAYIPGGTFKMGRNDGAVYDKPAHDVTVRPFFMDIYEVTNEEYAKFIQATGYKPPPTWKGGVMPADAGRKPVTGLIYDDAEAYSRWAGKRLPTEEEWEFAARGTDGRLFPWGGDKWDKTKALANANAVSKAVMEVGSFKDGVSPFGIYDMAGNAWEWTSTPLEAYPGGKLPEVPAKNTMVIRGGCYISGLDGITATYRGFYRKSGEDSYNQTGVRCVKDAP